MDGKFYINDKGSESREAAKIQTTANIAAAITTLCVKRLPLVNIFFRVGTFVARNG